MGLKINGNFATKEYVNKGTRPDVSYTADDDTTLIDTETTPLTIYLAANGAKKQILNFSIPATTTNSKQIKIVTTAASYTLQRDAVSIGTFGPGTTTLLISGDGTFKINHIEKGQFATLDTTDNVTTEIDRITVPTDSITLVEVALVGARTNNVGEQLAGGKMRAQVKNEAGSVNFSSDLESVYSQTGTTIGGDGGVINPADSPSFTISGGDLIVNVRGGTGWNVTWNSVITYKTFDLAVTP